MDRVLKKIREIKSETVFWGSGAEPQQLFQNAEVSMGMIYSNRGLLAERDTKGRYKLVWNEALSQAGGYIVPKGNPAGRENVMKFLASCQDPEKQINLFKCLGQAPSNPAAAAMIPPELKRYNSTDPENLALQIHADNHWYAKNYETALEAYLNEIAS
jgi:putative spermidine/putrescine transport system substrate-binding protein